MGGIYLLDEIVQKLITFLLYLLNEIPIPKFKLLHLTKIPSNIIYSKCTS